MEETFGSFLRETRRAKRMSLKCLARNIGVSAPYICRVEIGMQPPFTEERINSASKALGMTTEESVKMHVLAGQGRRSYRLPRADSAIKNQCAAALALNWGCLEDHVAREIMQTIQRNRGLDK